MKKSQLKWLATACLTTAIFATAPYALANEKPVSTSLHLNNAQENYVPNTLVVQYKEAFTYAEITKLKGLVTAQMPSLHSTIVQFKNETDFKNAISTLSMSEKVEKLSLSPKYQLTALKDDKADEQYIHQLLHTKKAYEKSGKKKVKIAIIDSGVDIKHPDLTGKVSKALNIVNPMSKQVPMSHGTHVSGIIAANSNNTIGGFGIYPNATILSYDVFNGSESANDYDIANAILQAIKDQAKIINMSLGGYGYSAIVEEAIQKAHAKGITVIAAAGNDSLNNKFYPAALENVISVGSTDADELRSSFSNYGSTLDVVAPGESIYSTSYSSKRGSTFEYMSGTSMASPVTASVAALLVSKNKNITPNEIEYILQHTAKDKGSKGYDVKYGAGLIQPTAAVAYNYKNIPSLNTAKWSDQTILDKANSIHASTIKGQFTKPNETVWKKIAVKKGQYVQVTATPAKNYDIKLTMKMLQKKNSTVVINDTSASEAEAGYIRASADGYIGIGVNDVNGHIQSNYTVDVQVFDSLQHDESSIEKPIQLSEPNAIIQKLHMNENDSLVDEDVFAFTATSEQLVQVKTSALPGVDLGIEVYKKEDIIGEEQQAPVVSINKNGYGEEEFASFLSEIGTTYYIVISNGLTSSMIPSNDLYNSLQDGLSQPKFSLLPYALELSSKDIPQDEDPIVYDLANSITINRNQPNATDSLAELFTKFGRPFNLKTGVTSYLQGSTDIDGYYFTSNKSAFYEFTTHVAHNAELPSITIYEVDASGNEQFIASNSSFDGIMSKKARVSLKAKTNYLLSVSSGSVGSIPQNGYEVNATLLGEDVEDAYENNDTAENAKKIAVNKTYFANFAKINDIDYYYFKAPSNGIYQLRMATTLIDYPAFSKAWDNRYTKALALYKDINHNKVMDAKDLTTFKPLPTDLTGGVITGSVEMKKNDTYFIFAAPDHFSTDDFFSIHPYELSMTKAHTVDEDAKNSVKNNTPSKAIKLVKKNSTTYSKKGYLNPGYMNGDEDWYSFKPTKTKNMKLLVKVPESMDAVIQVYTKGKLVKKIDYYGEGDTEIGHAKLKKNTTYFIKITDRQGNAFVEPYELILK